METYPIDGVSDAENDLSKKLKALQARDDWEALGTRERTQLVCGVYMQHQGQIPVWTTLLETVKRGSSQTIQKAKKDFLATHASELRRLAGQVSGIPESLQATFRKIWIEALAEAEQVYRGQVANWESQLLAARTDCELAQEECADARQRAQDATLELNGIKKALEQALAQIEHEVASRQKAESLAQDYRLSLEAQKAALARELDDSKAALAKALDRLEAVEARMLNEIARVRTESEKHIATNQARHDREKAQWEGRQATLEERMGVLNESLQTSRSQVLLLEQDRRHLAELLEQQKALTVEAVHQRQKVEALFDLERNDARTREAALKQEIERLLAEISHLNARIRSVEERRGQDPELPTPP